MKNRALILKGYAMQDFSYATALGIWFHNAWTFCKMTAWKPIFNWSTASNQMWVAEKAEINKKVNLKLQHRWSSYFTVGLLLITTNFCSSSSYRRQGCCPSARIKAILMLKITETGFTCRNWNPSQQKCSDKAKPGSGKTWMKKGNDCSKIFLAARLQEST